MISLKDALAYIANNFKYRKLRTYLTLIAIAIGVCAIVVLMSISDGLIEQIKDQLQAFGPKNAVIIPGDTRFNLQTSNFRLPTQGKLYEKDYQTVKLNPAIVYLNKRINFRTSLNYKGQDLTVSVGGVEPEKFFKMMNLSVKKGRLIEQGEEKAAVIGVSFTDKSILKKEQMDVGSIFYLGDNKTKFKVVGILEDTNAVAKNAIIINIEDAKKIAYDEKKIEENELSAIAFQVADDYELKEVVEQIEDKLKTTRKLPIGKKDFTIVTADFILAQVSSIIGIATAFVGFITGLSFLIGGIGIANTLYMNVIERTKEIGIMRAVGARKRDISYLVLLEGGITGSIGGILGLIIGIIVAQIITQFGFKTKIGFEVVIAAITVSFLVGTLASYWPAKIASELEPIKAISSAGR
jgi:putative ABC transport system permease protein